MSQSILCLILLCTEIQLPSPNFSDNSIQYRVTPQIPHRAITKLFACMSYVVHHTTFWPCPCRADVAWLTCFVKHGAWEMSLPLFAKSKAIQYSHQLPASESGCSIAQTIPSGHAIAGQNRVVIMLCATWHSEVDEDVSPTTAKER